MNEDLFERYRELQRYVQWTEYDAKRIASVGDLVRPSFGDLVDDFYDEIQRHPRAIDVITDGEQQIARLKQTLTNWLQQLFTGQYDAEYVRRRWQVGWRHVEIGLEQVFTNVALSRLRSGLLRELQNKWNGDAQQLFDVMHSLNKLMDLDLAIIESAYQAEYSTRLQHRSEARFRSLVEAAPSMIVILRSDHTIQYFSPHAENISGYSTADVLHKNYCEMFVPKEHHERVTDAFEQALADTPNSGFENPILCRDGTIRWMVWNARRLADYQGSDVVLAVGQDVTNLKHAQERALQAERLAAIGQMMTGLAHESGNALARSQACLEMLSYEVEDRPEALELIHRAQAAQDHLRQLYDEIRGYAAPLRLEREEWDVSGIWRQAWQNLSVKRLGRQVELVEQTNDASLTCRVDNFRLEQVFRNIFENSLAACNDPVRIQVESKPVRHDDQRALQIAIIDNGPGLTPEQRKHIFNPFYTTKSKGTGLGMAIAKRILDAHGGEIEVGDAVAGAKIVLILPRNTS